MNYCPNCHQPVEAGAAFCGNCGAQLAPQAPASPAPQQIPEQAPVAQSPPPSPPPPAANQVSPLAQPFVNPGPAAPAVPTGPLIPAANGAAMAVPNYALPHPGQHIGETKAILSLIFGLLGLAGVLLMVFLGLAFGLAGVVLGTMSRGSTKRGLSTAGLIISSVAIIVNLGGWAWLIKDSKAANPAAASAPAVSSTAVSNFSTQCYSVGFADKLNVTNSQGSCDLIAFNGQTEAASSNVYKVYANQDPGVTSSNFTSQAKAAVEKDIAANLPGFVIQTEEASQFANSPDYAATAYDKTDNVSVVEAAVLHVTKSGNNLFVLVHGVNGTTVDLNDLQAQWQWN